MQREAAEIREEWLGRALSTLPADRPATEAAISELYRLIGLAPPRFHWVSSPVAALTTVPPGVRLRPSETVRADGRMAAATSAVRTDETAVPRTRRPGQMGPSADGPADPPGGSQLALTVHRQFAPRAAPGGARLAGPRTDRAGTGCSASPGSPTMTPSAGRPGWSSPPSRPGSSICGRRWPGRAAGGGPVKACASSPNGPSPCTRRCAATTAKSGCTMRTAPPCVTRTGGTCTPGTARRCPPG